MCLTMASAPWACSLLIRLKFSFISSTFLVKLNISDKALSWLASIVGTDEAVVGIIGVSCFTSPNCGLEQNEDFFSKR